MITSHFIKFAQYCVIIYCLYDRYGYVFEDSDPTFNAGVYGINFDLWRSKNVHREVQYWLEEVSSHRYHGSTPSRILI